ncbi:MAG TPA: hypothetical protein VJ951_12385 [Bacteroidales bacterium]|nr:hypothetical protein [Bacteroidales bacterium]
MLQLNILKTICKICCFVFLWFNNRGKKNIITVFLFVSIAGFSQTGHYWWNQKHDWDGKTHWTQYMTMSPGFLGPNALPVPEFYPASIPSTHNLNIGLEGHYSKGDKTLNSLMDYVFPAFSERASIQVLYRTIEIYNTDTVTRDLRASRDYNTTGTSMGDVYVSTYIQLIKDHEKLPDIMLSANIKTASGTNLEAARNTDTPGYWFDVTMGKYIHITKQSKLKIYAKGGFYAYQKFKYNEYQNDACLYGIGFLANIKNLKLEQQLTGYHGYFNNGDRPMVYRIKINGPLSNRLTYKIMFQQGFNDFNYSSLRFAIGYQLKTITADI